MQVIKSWKKHIGKITKVILEKFVKHVILQTSSILWKNSSEVINWFDEIQNKNNKCFIIFDIEKFYLSIKHEYLKKGINFSENYIRISDNY